MKNFYFLIAVLCLLFTIGQANAQNTRIVKVNGWDGTGDIESFNNVLSEAIDNDSTERKINPNVIFELKPGQVYPQGMTIRNYDYHLHIKAEEGTGPKPIIMPGKMANGNYGAKFIISFNHVTLDGIELSGHTPTGGVLNRMFEFSGNSFRCVVNNCHLDGDRGALIALFGDSASVFLSDSKFGNTGHRITSGGNGRTIDFRPTALYVDTLVVQNCTHYSQTDRLIRNMGTVVNYLKWDHNSAINNVGFHGSLQLGDVKEAYVTNNIFANSISLGHYDARTQEQTQPEKFFSVISLNGTSITNQVVVVRNNNIYSDQALIDVWAKYDSVSAPLAITPTVEDKIGAANVNNAWFSEPLSFNSFCGPISDYVDAFLSNPAASSFPENWCVGGDGGYYPEEIDASYGTTANSYTKADNGFPLGDLNFYPERKTAWLKWNSGDSLTNTVDETILTGNAIKMYPNPANSVLNFSSTVETVIIYSLDGKFLKSANKVNAISISDLKTGIYFVNIISDDIKTIQRVVVSR